MGQLKKGVDEFPLIENGKPSSRKISHKKRKKKGIARLEKADLNLNQNLSKQDLKESLFLFFSFFSPGRILGK